MKNIISFFIATVITIGLFMRCSKVEQPALYHPPLTDTISYTESKEDFPNPERGFYRYAETYGQNYEPLNAEQLKQWRTLQNADDGNYKIYSTLVYRGIVLKGFTDKDLPADLLSNIQNDFTAARSAGVKLILRFAYNIDPKSGSCSEGFICPPYKDAPKQRVLNHIAQLKPLLQENADVLACMQMGFVGMWGENYYSDYFGDASSNADGKFNDQNWKDKSDVLKAVLDAVPADRMVQVRTPQLKQRFLYGAEAPINSQALTEAGAFNETDMARIGFHNDCFLSSPDDYGTYDDYGNSSSPRLSGNLLKPYMMEDSRYVAVGGETCDDAYSPANDCENAGKAQTEMKSLHYSFLNCAYNNDVNNDWQTGGCMDSIKKDLGYRFILRKSIIPSGTAQAGKLYSFNLFVENIGYASPFNMHPLKIILRNKENAEELSLHTTVDIRKWYSGSINQQISVLLPPAMNKGTYDIFLYLPDKYESIANRPEYAIRFANENVWDEETGYNSLGFAIQLK